LICTLLVFVGYSSGYGSRSSYSDDKILLEKVNVLTFTKGHMTTGNRSQRLPQLQCVGGSACSSRYEPSVVQCKNVGSDGIDVQWKCEADLESAVKFGATIVSCEGYDNPDDPYVLKGSCGLEYSLEYTEKGSSYGGSYGGSHGGPYEHNSYNYSTKGINWGEIFMFVIFGLIVVGLIRQCNQNAAQGTNYGTGSNYGGSSPGGGPGTGPGAGPGSGGYGGGPSCSPSQPTYQPGFWTGLGGGGLLGYMFGRNRGYGYGTGSSYGTGYGSGYRSSYRPSFGGSSFGGSSFGGSSSSTRTASAFASTRRR